MISGRILGRGAGSGSTTQIAGMRELLQGLSDLPFQLGKGAIYAALGGAGAIVRKEAVALAPQLSGDAPAVLRGERKSGTLKRAIRVSRSKINRGKDGLWEVIVRVKPLKRKQVTKFKSSTGLKSTLNPDDPYYWWWVEFGTSKMAARPFLRPAFEGTKDAQLQAMRTRMKAGLERAALKIQREVMRAAA